MKDTIDSGIIAAFEDELELLYWGGYAENLRESNPNCYYMLLAAYKEVFA